MIIYMIKINLATILVLVSIKNIRSVFHYKKMIFERRSSKKVKITEKDLSRKRRSFKLQVKSRNLLILVNF